MSKKSEQAAAAASSQITVVPAAENKPPDMPFFLPNDENQSVYRFILASARRARQLQGGARPSISTTSRKPTRIAMEEVRTGAVHVEILEADFSAERAKLMDQPVQDAAPAPVSDHD